MAYTTYSATIHAGTTFWKFLLYCLKVCWTACVFTPHVFNYWIGRAHFFYQKSKLSWWWWLLLITLYWNEPERRPGKENGTYWMLVRAEKYDIIEECKNLARDRNQFKRFSKFDGRYKSLWTFILSAFWVILMLFIDFIGIGYFICFIVLFKCRYIVMMMKSKRVWNKLKKKQTYHAYSTVLNIDKRLQDQSIKFDTDSSMIIYGNSANIHICIEENMFISSPRLTYPH